MNLHADSPYQDLKIADWQEKTRALVAEHPLKSRELVEVTLKAWDDIFSSAIGTRAFQVGADVFPPPQIMGFLLHELVGLELAHRYPGIWRGAETAGEKDLTYIPDARYSVEIKTSSSRGKIFGNRSYAQEAQTLKKSKSGYYLAINFEKFTPQRKRPGITRVRFGWLDHGDWLGQTAATGQQARLGADVDRFKLLDLLLPK